jgi:hypothetical protein
MVTQIMTPRREVSRWLREFLAESGVQKFLLDDGILAQVLGLREKRARRYSPRSFDYTVRFRARRIQAWRNTAALNGGPKVPSFKCTAPRRATSPAQPKINRARSAGEAEELPPAPPNNIEAERAILGAVLIDNRTLDTAIEKLKLEDFFHHHHQLIYRQMIALSEEHQAIDLITLTEKLKRAAELESVGGAAYISQLMDGVPHVTNVEHYVRIVKDDAARRRAISEAQAITAASYERQDVAEIKSRLVKAASVISVPEERATTITGAALLAMDVKPREWLIENLITARSMSQIFSWRGIGKTWAALSVGHAAASGGSFLKWRASRKHRVLYIDGELDAASLKQRLKSLGAGEENLKLLCCDMQDYPFPNLATARAQRMVEHALGDNSELLILDNLSALAPSSNETEAEDWISIQTWLLELRRQGLPNIFLHHAGHSGWSRGTTRREDLLDLVIELRRPKDYVASEGLRFELHFTKTRGMMGTGADPVEARLSTGLGGELLWTWRDLEDVRLSTITELKSADKTWREIENVTGIPRSTAERLWRNSQGK